MTPGAPSAALNLRVPTRSRAFGDGQQDGRVRREASVLHLDLDAFFAAVEQRDKPSLRGKPVIVGGTGQRGVVATASYEARVFGVRSAMPTHEARRRAPNAAFLSGRFDAYREASGHVMAALRRLSPLVEPLSLDEAFVDLRAATRPVSFDRAGLEKVVEELRAEVNEVTSGLHASVGVASSKFLAKVATELAKPDGRHIVDPGTEVEMLQSMKVGVIPGVGPVTQERLHRIGIHLIGELQGFSLDELAQVVGRAQAQALVELAYARDDRPVEPERETKSISVEDTFETDLVDAAELGAILARDARQVTARLRAAGLFARTVTIKVRRHDFSTFTRSRTLLSATDRLEMIAPVAQSLLAAVDLTGGVRLLGMGVAGLTDVLQEDLFAEDTAAVEEQDRTAEAPTETPAGSDRSFRPGTDVEHDVHGRGWVWGSGLGRVTVRFETWDSTPGPIRTFPTDDAALHPAAPLPPGRSAR
jgi:DNA polymerase-4